MTVVVVALDAEAAEFVRYALEARRRRKGRLPAGLLLATSGHSRTTLDVDAGSVDDAGVAPMLMTKTRAAAELGLNAKTIQRLTGTGKLPTVKVNGRSMVRRVDLEAYVTKLGAAEVSA